MSEPKPPPAAGPADLEEWRNEELSRMLATVGVGILVIGLLHAIRSGFIFGAALGVTGLGFLGWSAVPKTHVRAHRTVFTVVVMLMWAAGLTAFGWVPGVVAGAVLIAVAATALTSQRVVWSLVVALFAISTIVMGSVALGVAPEPHPLIADVGVITNWLVAGGVTLVCVLIGVGTVRRGLGTQVQFLARLESTVGLLEAQAVERARLRAEEAELLHELRPSRRTRIASAVGPALGHVFNNALTTALTVTETARESGDRADAEEATRVLSQVVKSCFDGAGYLLSLARPAETTTRLANMENVAAIVERTRPLLRNNVRIESELEAAGGLPISASQLEELISVLLNLAATSLIDGGEIRLRTYAHVAADSSVLDRGHWVVLETTIDEDAQAVDQALQAILSESVRRAGAVVHARQDDGYTTRVFLPTSLVLSGERSPQLPDLGTQRALRTVSGFAAMLAIATAAAVAVATPELRVVWLVVGLATAVPMAWAALSRSLSSSGRLILFVLPLSTSAAATIALQGYGHALAVAALCTTTLAAAAYGSQRATVGSLGLLVIAFVVGTIQFVGEPHVLSVSAPRYMFLVPAACALAALIALEPIRQIRQIVASLQDAQARLIAGLTGVMETDEAVDALRVASEQADERSAAGRHVTVLAHDMNNCLTVISGWASLCEIADSSDERMDALDAVYQGCRHAQAVVESFGNMDEPRPAVPVDLNDLLTRLLPLAQSLVEARSLELRLDPNVGWALADEHLLRRAVLNLVANARDAVEPSGTIEIGSRLGEHGPAVFVRDDGHGMDPATLSSATDLLFTTKGRKGTGLGLHSVRTITEHFGGTLSIESAPDEGTEVALGLLAAAARQPDVPRIGATSRVLVVDDEPMIVRSLSRGLRRAGIEVVEAGSGDEALDAIGNGQFDAICCDAVMPGASVSDVLETFQESHPDGLIVLMSGYNPPTLPARIRPHVAFLQKPFSAQDLMRVLRAG